MVNGWAVPAFGVLGRSAGRCAADRRQGETPSALGGGRRVHSRLPASGDPPLPPSIGKECLQNSAGSRHVPVARTPGHPPECACMLGSPNVRVPRLSPEHTLESSPTDAVREFKGIIGRGVQIVAEGFQHFARPLGVAEDGSRRVCFRSARCRGRTSMGGDAGQEIPLDLDDHRSPWQSKGGLVWRNGCSPLGRC